VARIKKSKEERAYLKAQRRAEQERNVKRKKMAAGEAEEDKDQDMEADADHSDDADSDHSGMESDAWSEDDENDE
jgi:hypothetical protein